MTEKHALELTESNLLARASELGLEIPVEQRQGVLSGTNRLLQATSLLREFLPPPGPIQK
jgi:hypothetical protein